LTPDILSSPYYLDTSVQIGRYGGMKRRELKAILREGNHSTSTRFSANGIYTRSNRAQPS